MAATDLSPDYANDPYVAGNIVVRWFAAGDGNMKAGYLCQDHATDAEKVIVCATDGQPFGMVAKQSDTDINTLIASGLSVEVMLPTGILVWYKHDGTAETITKGGILGRSNTVAGAIEKFTYADGVSELASAIGRGAQLIATGGTAIWIFGILGL